MEDCDNCSQHSGMEGRYTLILWLLGILIAVLVTVGGFLAVAVSDIRTQISTVPYQYEQLVERNRETKEEIKDVKTRLQQLEIRVQGKR